MRLLRIKIEGLTLFTKSFDFSLVTSQRMTERNDESVTRLFNRIYINNVVALVGKNASGKTMTLNLINFVNHVFLQNEPLNHAEGRIALIGQQFKFTTYYYDELENQLYKVVSTINKSADPKATLSFGEEMLYAKPVTLGITRSNLFDFSNAESVDKRIDDPLLPEDNTYFRKVTKRKAEPPVIAPINDFIAFTRSNLLMAPLMDKFPELQGAIIAYLDPTVEYIRTKKDLDPDTDSDLFILKFKGKSKILVVNAYELFSYLSAGTIKGLNLFAFVFLTLATGGTFIVDEIENHFHRAIVQTILSFFTDPEVNANRATLIFTTHYPQLLDQFSRSDDIYFTTRKTDLIELERFSNRVKRSDVKKSDIYESDFLDGTAPEYAAYDQLRGLLAQATLTRSEKSNTANEV